MRIWHLCRVLIPALILVFTAACGEDDGGGDDTSTDASSSGMTDSNETPEKKWSEMSRGERITFMTLTLHPAMETVFKQKDSMKFSDFECESCHGADYTDSSVDYAMPNPNVGDADGAMVGDGIPGKIDYGSTDAEYVDYRDSFMPAVALQVAQILDLEPESLDNPDGFGCKNCHPQ